MKVVCLNIWGGRAGKAGLLTFFEQCRDEVDIFCLQEVWSDRYEELEGVMAGGKPIDHSEIMIHGLQEITATLPNHQSYFRPQHGDHYGLCIFIRKDISILEEGEVFVHLSKGYMPEVKDIGKHARNIQYVTFLSGTKPVTVINFHGLWNGQGKDDSDDRLAQSDKINDFIRTIENPLILCGDFNLKPNTASLKKLEDAGLENLIKTHSITSTRTSFYDKAEKFADYMLIRKEVNVKDFKVLPEEVSDHAALCLEFDIDA
ncbi:MAG: endonuclease/exonuclease/phosphatase family protein [Candidatus Paceibacterota bacterium]